MATGSNALSPPPDPQIKTFTLTQENSNRGEGEGAKRKPSLASVEEASTRADVRRTDDKAMRSPLPLFASDVWSVSTHPPARSAGLPPKPSWETLKSPAHQTHPSATASHHSFSSNHGVSDSMGGKTGSRRNDQHRLDFRESGAAVRYTQTEEYHNSGGLVVKTDPLPQQPFAFMRASTTTSSNGRDLSVRDMTDTPKSFTSALSSDIVPSICDTEHAQVNNKLALSAFSSDDASALWDDASGDIWTERQHARCLRRALKDPKAEWEEAYKGALSVLAAVNPEHFRMPANSRVINIKTEHLDNLITSIRLGKYSVMAKISKRIMKVMADRVDPSEKLLFLFSVNGSKKFSGLAEVSGPWDPNSFIEGWTENSESHGSTGSFPVTWVFVKDVPYYHFTHIRQEGNEHPVGNMWNGMNFPAGTGRKVIQHYVETPATTSILGHPKNYGDFGLRHEGHSFSQRRGTISNRGQRGGRTSFRGGSINTSWRQPSKRQSRYESSQDSNTDDNDATPTPASRGRLEDTAQAPPAYTLSATGENKFQQRDLGSISFDANGDQVTFPPSFTSFGDTSSTASSMLASPTGAIVRKPRRQDLPNLDVLGSKDYVYGERQGRPLSAVSSNHSTGSAAPAVSFSATNVGHGGLQHSVSMGVLGSNADDRPMLPPSASMNSLLSQTEHTPRGDLVPVLQADSSPNPQLRQLYARTLPLRQEWAQDTQTSVAQERIAKDLLSHTSSRTDVDMNLGPHAVQHQLMAQYHMLQAERFNLQHQVSAMGTPDTDRRYINAQIARNGIELQAVEAEMSMASSGPIQNQSPVRYNIFQHDDTNSSSPGSGPNFSPVRASHAGSNYSASLFSSPYSAAESQYLTRPQHRGRDSRSSWELRAQAVDDLVSSPKHDDNGHAATARLQSAPVGFPSHTGDSNVGRINFSFHPPAATQGHSTQRGGVRIDA